MFLYTFLLDTESAGAGGVIYFNADNFASQNKSLYLLWFCGVLVLSGLQKIIVLKFLIFCHTNNSFDGAFSKMKKNVQNRRSHPCRDYFPHL